MKLNELKQNKGATHYKKRVGRGIASGTGKTAGRGHKGQKARSGSRNQATFQGGQLNIFRRFPKFGFVNPFAKNHAEINLGDIEKFIKAGRIDASKEISIDSLLSAKIISRRLDGLKVLGRGELKSKINIVATKWSKSAEAAIVKAGGTIKNAR
jgi:large subunit ribosomal protein L15